MKAKQMAALCSLLGLTLSGAAYADSGMSGGSQQQQWFSQGVEPMGDDQVMSDRDSSGKLMVPQGINHPARINPAGSNDFFVSGSFIYWMASSDGFNIQEAPFLDVPLVGLVPLGANFETFTKPKFKPGFKVGLGYNSGFDDWTAYLEYTWLHQTDRNTFFANHNDGDNDADDRSNYIFLLARDPFSIASDVLHTKWRLNLDIADFTLSRAYYVGKRLTVEPFGGIRAAWIHQKFNLNLSSSSPTTAWATDPFVQSNLVGVARCNSWGLGARLGMHSQWLLGMGFRLDAKASGSMLFTRYTKLVSTSSTTGGLFGPQSSSLSFVKHYDVMRPNAEMGLGLGWGTYMGSDNGYHIDIAATYDFNIFWSQNMLRGLADTFVLQTGVNPTDIMYHGLTATVRLDF